MTPHYFISDFLLLIQVMLLIDIELSYINTNHEDFIGFAKYVPHHIVLTPILQLVTSKPSFRKDAAILNNHTLPTIVIINPLNTHHS